MTPKPITTALTLALATSLASAASAYPLKFPARGNSVDSGVYLATGGHGGYGTTWALDVGAVKYDNGWSGYVNGDNSANENAYVFGVPLYAPIDGEVITCWRTAPDKPDPNTDYDIDGDGVPGEPGDDKSPIAAGNHLQIRTTDGDYIFYVAHLQFDSIPPELCPLPASRDSDGDGWPDQTGKDNCDGLTGKWDGYPEDTLLPTPVPVKSGDFLGRIGHSGASTGPHLHMHVKPIAMDGSVICETDSIEIEFVETWAQECDSANVTSAGWDRLNVENPLNAGSNPRHCFLPDGIGPQRDHFDLSTPATDLSFETHSSGDVLVYRSSGNLRLRAFAVDDEGELTIQDVQNEGSVLDAAVARPRSGRDVVVSIRGSNGKLKHIPYSIDDSTGAIDREYGKELSEGTIGQVESTRSPTHYGFVVAIEDGAGNLKVIDYDVSSSLTISRNSGSGSGGAVSDIAITGLSTDYDGVFTAELSPTGNLTVRTFDAPASGGVSAADTYGTFLFGQSVDVYTIPTLFGTNEVVLTALITNTGDLRLDTWIVAANGDITWIESASAGAVSTHAGAVGLTAHDFVSVVRDGGGDFRMIGWTIGTDGSIRRTATREGGAITDAVVNVRRDNASDHIVAARVDSSGDVHLFTYGENFAPYY